MSTYACKLGGIQTTFHCTDRLSMNILSNDSQCCSHKRQFLQHSERTHLSSHRVELSVWDRQCLKESNSKDYDIQLGGITMPTYACKLDGVHPISHWADRPCLSFHPDSSQCSSCKWPFLQDSRMTHAHSHRAEHHVQGIW